MTFYWLVEHIYEKHYNPVTMKRILQTTKTESNQSKKIETILSLEAMLQIRGGSKGEDPDPGGIR